MKKTINILIISLILIFLGISVSLAAFKWEVDYPGGPPNPDLPSYFNYIYKLSFFIAAFLAVLMIIIGGIQWTTSGASPYIKLNAKRRITKALTGFIMLLAIFLIFREINPDILVLKAPVGENPNVVQGTVLSKVIYVDCHMPPSDPNSTDTGCHEGGDFSGFCGDHCDNCCENGFGYITGYSTVGLTGLYNSLNVTGCGCFTELGATYTKKKVIEITDCKCYDENHPETMDNNNVCAVKCFNECRNRYGNQKNIFGVISGWNNPSGWWNDKHYCEDADVFWCSCYEITGDSILNTATEGSSTTFRIDNSTAYLKCKFSNGRENPNAVVPECSEFCHQSCRDRGYNFGIWAGTGYGGDHGVWCSCFK